MVSPRQSKQKGELEAWKGGREEEGKEEKNGGLEVNDRGSRERGQRGRSGRGKSEKREKISQNREQGRGADAGLESS